MNSLFISSKYYRTKGISVSKVKINLFTQELMKTQCRIMKTDNGKCICFSRIQHEFILRLSALFIECHIPTSQRKQKSFDCLQRQARPAEIQWRSWTVMMTTTRLEPSRSKVVRWPWSVMSVMSVTMGSTASMIASHSA